jgi:hypothetical protein
MHRALHVSPADEREGSETDRGRLRSGRNRGRPVAAAGDAKQRLHPLRAAEAGGDVGEPVPKAGARAQEERANRGCAERELSRELAVAEPADLPEEERVALRLRHPSDLVPHGRELACTQYVHRGVHGRSARGFAGRDRCRSALTEARVALVAGDREEPRERFARHRAVEERAMRGEEDLLCGVLRLAAVAQERAAERCNRGAVRAVQRLGVLGVAVALGCDRSHGDGEVYGRNGASDLSHP